MAIKGMRKMGSLEEMPLTIGLAIGLGFLVVGIVSTVWGIATIRSNDKKEMRGEWQQALKDLGSSISKEISAVLKEVVRLENKTDENNDQQHSRQSRTIERLDEVNAKVEYQRGVTDTMLKFMLKKDKKENGS